MNEEELILTHVLNKERIDLYSQELLFTDEQLREIERIQLKRDSRYPLQYILGKAEFMGLEIKVKEGVFIPRPETEILVEEVIKLLRTMNYTMPAGRQELRTTRILDIGTGSGCIAIALAKFIPYSFIVALDNSQAALSIAKENAYLNRVDKRIEFVEADISTSTKGVIKGIHGSDGTGKLVSCLYGKFQLVVVNCDKQSDGFYKHATFVLSDKNRRMVYVPPKFGNGHQCLSDYCIFHYYQTEYYDPKGQFTVKWDDELLNIFWPLKPPILSIRDGGK